MPKRLVNDIEFIAKNLGINRAEWMNVKLAEMIAQEKMNVMNNIEKRYIKGFMSDKDFKEKTGVLPTKEIKAMRENMSKQTQTAFDRVLKESLEKAYPGAKGYQDEYIKKLISTFEKKKNANQK